MNYIFLLMPFLRRAPAACPLEIPSQRCAGPQGSLWLAPMADCQKTVLLRPVPRPSRATRKRPARRSCIVIVVTEVTILRRDKGFPADGSSRKCDHRDSRQDGGFLPREAVDRCRLRADRLLRPAPRHKRLHERGLVRPVR